MGISAIQPARITRVIPHSIAADLGLEEGDAIFSINGQRPRDLIDYQYLCAEEELTIVVVDKAGQTHEVEIEKDYDNDLGLEFETALFDGLIQCNNGCPFCFIDQQPPGKRGTLYLKDDDYRLSFLYGSYLTLTNLTEREWLRIEQMRLSPLYVSVHATNPEIRVRLLKNPRAGVLMDQLKWFQARQLQIHGQVVLCPGINDGIHLERTLLDLSQFYNLENPTVASIAVVPVGLTQFRPAEDALCPVTPEQAMIVIQQVQSLQEQFRQQLGTTLVWLADEWFLIAQQELPAASHYEDYPQIGNGVGSIRLFLKQFQSAARQLPRQTAQPRSVTWVVGNAVEKAFQPIVHRLNQVQGLSLQLAPLQSEYWGQSLTVTGLLTGYDLIHGLQGRELGDKILLPSVMLKHGEDRFLDDMTLSEVQSQVNKPIQIVDGIPMLIQACLQ
ncbi:MAG: TIGR03279 family radical SAM protein [Synechococcales bacterium]|nr:TIGR03279 family radical SAM protein [Cyanobacteria bacterium REEB444]MEB3124832.1 TIGR03279 family radical SAM protein [Synechococcales bacterium]